MVDRSLVPDFTARDLAGAVEWILEMTKTRETLIVQR
jgi:hypothetical protein